VLNLWCGYMYIISLLLVPYICGGPFWYGC